MDALFLASGSLMLQSVILDTLSNFSDLLSSNYLLARLLYFCKLSSECQPVPTSDVMTFSTSTKKRTSCTVHTAWMGSRFGEKPEPLSDDEYSHSLV
jgi:hypothetical protein